MIRVQLLTRALMLSDVQSNFIEVSIFLNAANLAAKRELLALYLNTFHSLPVVRDGSRLPFSDVVRLLDTETVDYDISFGSSLSEQIEVSIKVEKGKYATAISWLRDLLFNSEFEESRLKITARKLEQNLPSEKREGLAVATSVLRGMTQDPQKSAAVTMGLLARLEDTPAIVKRLKEEPEAVVKDLEELRKACMCNSSLQQGLG
jgi:Zn-dependent M16 (insulinase) family peptidase